MQVSTINLSTQSKAATTIDVDLLEQAFQARLEAFALNAHQPLDHYQEQDLPRTAECLEMALLELRFLLNEIKLLGLLKAL
ncbi:MAG TPA: hypothetical protein DCS93_37590 [Microscillaceae bacterium]|nr:hypothetical protein [Microscillaceae bacterium]